MQDSIAEPDDVERVLGAFIALPAFHSGIHERHLDIGERSHAWQQVECLEHESDLVIPDARQLSFVHCGYRQAIQPVVAATCRIEAANDVHERRLAGPGRPHDRKIVAPLYRQVHIAERIDEVAPHLVAALEMLQANDGLAMRR